MVGVAFTFPPGWACISQNSQSSVHALSYPTCLLSTLVLTLIWSLACDLDVKEELTPIYMQGLFSFGGQLSFSYSAFEKKNSTNFDGLARGRVFPQGSFRNTEATVTDWPGILQTQEATLVHDFWESSSAEIWPGWWRGEWAWQAEGRARDACWLVTSLGPKATKKSTDRFVFRHMVSIWFHVYITVMSVANGNGSVLKL